MNGRWHCSGPRDGAALAAPTEIASILIEALTGIDPGAGELTN